MYNILLIFLDLNLSFIIEYVPTFVFAKKIKNKVGLIIFKNTFLQCAYTYVHQPNQLCV